MAFYARTFPVPFYYDDRLSLLQNPSLELPPIWRPFSPPLGGATVSGRPLLNFTFALNRALSGAKVWSYHAVNLAIHVSAGLVLYGLVRRTWRRLRPGDASADGGAFTVAALWLWHPLQTESVTYIVQRAESLAGLFFLLALYAFLRGLESSRRSWLMGSVLCAVAGAGCKETIAVAPAVVLLYDRMLTGNWRSVWQLRRGYHAALLLSWAVLAAWLLANGLDRGGSAGFDSGSGWLAYWKTQPEAIARYCVRAIWPFRLIFLFGDLPARPGWFYIGGMAVIGVLAVLAFVAALRGRVAGFLCCTFFLLLAPTSLVPGTLQFVVEHRMYLPLACLIAGVVLGIARIQRLRSRLAQVGLVVGLFLGAATLARNEEYRSPLQFWAANVARRPGSAQAQSLFGDALAASGRPREAAEHYQRALDLSPPQVRDTDLGLLAERNGDLAGAHREFSSAIAADPHVAFSWLCDGRVLAHLGRWDEALDRLRRAIALSAPTAADREAAEALAGICAGRLGRMDEAAAFFRAALALRPDDADVHYNLAYALRSLGAPAESRAELAKALALRPELRQHATVPSPNRSP